MMTVATRPPPCVVSFPDSSNEMMRQPIPLELRALDQRIDIRFQPIVRRIEAAIMTVIAPIRSNECIVGQGAGRHVRGKLREWHDILPLTRTVLNVRQIRQGNVAGEERAPIRTGRVAAYVADRRDGFGVLLPGQARCRQLPDHVIR